MKNLALVIIIALLQVHSFASETCQSLFENSGHSVDQIIKELYTLRKNSLNSQGRAHQLSKILFDKKKTELSNYIPESEIDKKLKALGLNDIVDLTEDKITDKKTKNIDTVKLAEIPEVSQILIKYIKDMKEDKSVTYAIDFLKHLTEDEYDEVIFEVLQSGIDLDRKIGGRKETSLHLFMWGNHKSGDERIEISKFLVRAGADINARDVHGTVPLTNYSGKDLKIIKFFIDNGADIFVKSASGQPVVLYWAAANDYEDVIKLFINAKFNLNTQDKSQQTALSWASMYGRKKIVELLLAANADFTLANSKGETPLAVAKKNGHGDIAQVLEAAGATK
jgi:hypothetical protein